MVLQITFEIGRIAQTNTSIRYTLDYKLATLVIPNSSESSDLCRDLDSLYA